MAAGGSDGNSSLLITSEDPIFEDLPKEAICPVCKHVLHNAHQLMCGHHVCQECINPLFNGNETIQCPTGDEECELLQKKEVFKDAYKIKEIKKLRVYCNYMKAGCKEIMMLKELSEHLKNCPYKPLPCTHVDSGCTYTGPSKDLQQHLDNVCQYVKVQCTHCGQQMQRRQLQEHENELCPQVMESCPYQCGSQKLPRVEMKEHKKTCPRRPAKCPYHVISCKFEGSEEQVANHCKETADYHLQLVLPFAKNMDDLNRQMKLELEKVEKEKDKVKEKMVDLRITIEELHVEIKSYKIQINDLKVKIVAQTEKILKMEESVPEFSKKDPVVTNSTDIRTLKQMQETLSEKLRNLEQRGSTGGVGLSGTSEIGDSSMAGQLGNLVQQIKNHDRQIAIQDIRMAELDLKFQILETANYDGVLMWKIRDYARRKQEAITGRTLSLYSQPFYTDRFGYKMCARVYLNGDGMGKGTHLSLFFVVMQGEFDALLPWPFQQKVTLKLLDHDTGGRDGIEDSFQPDPSSNSYIRPTSEMNVATGCPLFVSHAVLETRKFIRDDTLFIKVQVDTRIDRIRR